jgi:hypothetical protein
MFSFFRGRCSLFVSEVFCGDSLDLIVATGASRLWLQHRSAKPKKRAKRELRPLSTGEKEHG